MSFAGFDYGYAYTIADCCGFHLVIPFDINHFAKKESEKTRGAMPLVSGPHLLSSMEDTSVARWSERALQRIRLPVQKHFLISQ